MTATTTTQTVKIGRITYTVTQDFEDGYCQKLGWLHGPRGDLAMVVRTEKGRLMAMGSRTIDRQATATVHDLLAPIFNTEETIRWPPSSPTPATSTGAPTAPTPSRSAKFRSPTLT